MKCKFCDTKHSMRDLCDLDHNVFNYHCNSCGAHYYGDKGKEKWYDKKTWDEWVNIVDGVDWNIFHSNLKRELNS